MTKRARLTTQAVLDAIAFSDDEEFKVDDPAEPFMEGSDEEFSNLDDLDDDYNDDEQPSLFDLPPGSSQSCPLSSTLYSSQSLTSSSPPSSQSHPPSTPSASTPAQWSSTLRLVTIHPFQSPVGPTVPIPDSPSKIFDLFFTPSLVQTIVDESNRYMYIHKIATKVHKCFYTGKQDSVVEKGLGAHVVKDLTSSLKGKYHHVYFDNFFTSTQLLTDLEQDGIYSCGTARKDRKGFPEALKKPKLSNRSVKVYVKFCN